MSERLSAFDLLDGDYNGAGLHRLQEALFAMKSSVRQAMDAGLSAEDFPVAKRLLLAVETGEAAAERLHGKMAGV